MSHVKSKQKIKRRRVKFSLNFNNWNPKEHPMQSDGDDAWNKTVMLSPGKYEYKFLIDGEWREDPQNDQTCPNSFGTHNSVLDITAP